MGLNAVRSQTMILLMTVAPAAMLLAGCELSPHIASYSVDSGVELRLELVPTHPVLAEYERVAVLSRHGHVTRQSMFPDTGGYSTTHLYRCGAEQLMLSGYHDSWVVAPSTGVFHEGRCADPAYLGVFDGDGTEDWRFYSAHQRPERLLKASGEQAENALALHVAE